MQSGVIKFEIEPEAESDIDFGYQWYEEKQKGLGEDFLAEVDRAFSIIRKLPAGFPFFVRNYRKVLLRKFPFLIIYKVEDQVIRVFAVFNTWQNPKKLTLRLRP